MNIAIVDDEKVELEAAASYIKEYLRENRPNLEADMNIQTFTCAKDFFDVFKPGLFQLVILDICMPEFDGMQIAQVIRARGDDDANIIFLTANDNFVLNGYRVFAIGYFIKPITRHAQEFAKAFEHVLHKISGKVPELKLTADGTIFSVPLRNVLYVDIDYRHRLCVYLADGKKFITADKYADHAKILLADERFIECYHRIIINMDYVKSMEHDDFILMDGTSIPISQRKKREVKINYMRYFAHR